MKKRLYISPATRVVTMLDMESQILNPSESRRLLKVDPHTEYYYDGTESTEDYLIKF